MLPDDKIMCHRTGFAVSCYDGVTKHKCRLWCHVSGTDAMGRDIDVYGCGDELDMKLLHEVAKEIRQTCASVDKVANEVKTSREQATVEAAHLINGLKATVPILQLISAVKEETHANLIDVDHRSGSADRGVADHREIQPRSAYHSYLSDHNLRDCVTPDHQAAAAARRR